MSKMLLSEVRDWIKTLNICEHHYIGKVDSKYEKSIGIYDRTERTPEKVCIGGRDQTLTKVKKVNILIRGTKNANVTELLAEELYEKIISIEGNFYINNHKVNFIKIATDGTVDVGCDDKGVYERVIWLDIYYE